MRKIALFVATTLVLSLAAVAYAQQTNRYTVSGSTSPTNAGSKAKPRPVGVKFGFQVSEASGNRPAVIEKYSIRFAGLNVNTNAFPKCSQATVDAEGPSGCPSASIVGSGFIENQTGATANPADKSIECNAGLSVINLGNNRASIFVQGDPNQTDARRRCQIELSAGIPARWVRASGGSAVALEFSVPDSLKNPGAPTISNAVVSVTSSIKRLTRKRNGKTVGFLESVGGCVRNKRNITVTFTPVSGSAATAQRLASCSK